MKPLNKCYHCGRFKPYRYLKVIDFGGGAGDDWSRNNEAMTCNDCYPSEFNTKRKPKVDREGEI